MRQPQYGVPLPMFSTGQVKYDIITKIRGQLAVQSGGGFQMAAVWCLATAGLTGTKAVGKAAVKGDRACKKC